MSSTISNVFMLLKYYLLILLLFIFKNLSLTPWWEMKKRSSGKLKSIERLDFFLRCLNLSLCSEVWDHLAGLVENGNRYWVKQENGKTEELVKPPSVLLGLNAFINVSLYAPSSQLLYFSLLNSWNFCLFLFTLLFTSLFLDFKLIILKV